MNWLKKLFNMDDGTTEVTITITSVQKYGDSDIMLSDAQYRTYSLGMGAILANPMIPGCKIEEVRNSLRIGGTLKVKVHKAELEDAKSSVINILRLCEWR